MAMKSRKNAPMPEKKAKSAPKRKAAAKRSPPAIYSRVLDGATDVYATKNKIAVRKVSGAIDPRTGKVVLTDKTRYYPDTEKNRAAVEKHFGKIGRGRESRQAVTEKRTQIMQHSGQRQKQPPAKAKKQAKPAGKTTPAAPAPKRNVIGRTERTLRIKLKRDFPFGKAGETFTVHKGDNGWTGNGGYWFVDFLRDGDLCEIVKREGNKGK